MYGLRAAALNNPMGLFRIKHPQKSRAFSAVALPETDGVSDKKEGGAAE